jgi:hypothetical protein
MQPTEQECLDSCISACSFELLPEQRKIILMDKLIALQIETPLTACVAECDVRLACKFRAAQAICFIPLRVDDSKVRQSSIE